MTLRLALLCGLAIAVSASAPFAADKPRICFVYPGSRTDGGWSESQEKGRLMVDQTLGERVRTEFVENVAEGPPSEPVVEKLAAGGCNMIFATAFGYMDAVLKAAAQHPNVKFEHATGYKTTRNVSTYSARFYQARFLMGRIAAKVSKSAKAVYVAPFPIPEVIEGVNAFELGARSVNPNFKTQLAWTDSWFAPDKEAKATEDAIAGGADIVAQGTDSTAPMQVAQARGVHAFGHVSDRLAIGGDAQLTALVYNWGAYDVRRIKDLLDGSWSETASWDGLSSGIFRMAPYTNMASADVKFATESEKMIGTGKLSPFVGPIKKADGRPWLKKGIKASDNMITAMDFLVEGVEGALPSR